MPPVILLAAWNKPPAPAALPSRLPERGLGQHDQTYHADYVLRVSLSQYQVLIRTGIV